MDKWDMNDIYVFHLAAKISVEESMKNPILYYKNNIGTTYNILEIMRKLGLKKIIFSSTAAVYDSTNYQGLFDVDSAICPSSIYGHSKYLAEEIIEKYVNLYNFKAVVFRFFNVGGGKDSKKAHHLIPKLVSAILEDKNWNVYGKNYNTKDGTCIRDYIHVDDIYIAFLVAIQLESNYTVINLGSGYGYSVLDVIETCKNVLTKSFNKYNIPRTLFKERRSGDPDILVSDISRTFIDLNWSASKTLEDIVIDTMVSYGMKFD